MQKTVFLSIVLFCTTGCGYWWALNYDRSANASIQASVIPEQSGEIVDAFRRLAMQHEFKLTVENKPSRSEHSRSISLEKRSIRVYATTVPDATVLNVGFYKSTRENLRPSDDTLNALALQFVEGIKFVEDVSIVDVKLSSESESTLDESDQTQ